MAGHGSEVLSSCGALLRRLRDLDPALVGSSHSAGVICHGDFGPHNVLLDPANYEVTALIDWEFCRVGDAIVDIAWCEWIVRMHHPAAVDCLPAFFDAYGERPAWSIRHQSMLDRYRWLEAYLAGRTPAAAYASGKTAPAQPPNGPSEAVRTCHGY